MSVLHPAAEEIEIPIPDEIIMSHQNVCEAAESSTWSTAQQSTTNRHDKLKYTNKAFTPKWTREKLDEVASLPEQFFCVSRMHCLHFLHLALFQ
jgi:hypothetical protein